MTKRTLEKLASNFAEIKVFLDDRKEVFKRSTKKDEVRGEIRGCLATLRRFGMISDAEFRVLLTYYTFI